MLSYTHTDYTYTENIYTLLALPLPPFLQSFRCVCEKDVPVRCESIRSRMRSELRCLDLQV